ncbi:MAG TPA: hypothetical protein VFC95_02880 [Guyparkeria sp.]|nr:hypothetical protein [Guyparkeria sp.]
MSQATDMLAKYLAAEVAILQGQEFTFEGRRLSRADLDSVRAGRKEWERKVNTEKSAATGAPTIGGLSYAVARLD